MNRRLITLIGMIFLTLTSNGAAAALRTFLEPRLVEEMETVRLTIRAEGTSQSEAPDLAPLLDDFEVLGNQTSSRISSINGRTIASVEYQISLRPRRTGELTVPGLKIGNEVSQELQLVVRPLDPELKESIANMVFFETDLSNNPVYVQAETILTRRLFYSQGVQIYSDLPGMPEVENAVVIPLGETQSRSVIRGGQRYGVIEQRFALFPEQSGALTIPSISVTSSVRLQSGGRQRRSGIRVATEPVSLEVMPIPVEYPSNAAWLPARDLELTQRWEPAVGSIDVGEPLNFKLEVTAIGNRGSAIPPVPLPLPADQFKIYPEAPAMTETADSGTITGQRRETYALIPTAPGTITVAPLTITWWDTTADQLRETKVAISTLRVTGTATPPLPETSPEPGSSEPQGSAEKDPGSADIEINGQLIIMGSLVALALMSLIVWLARRSNLALSLSRQPAAGERAERRRSLDRLRKAARQNDLAAFRHDLSEFLTLAYATSSHHALNSFRRYPGAALLLRDLDQAIYAPESGVQPDLQSLTALAETAAAQHRERRTPEALPPLYG